MKIYKDKTDLSIIRKDLEYQLAKANAIYEIYPNAYYQIYRYYSNDNSIFDELDGLLSSIGFRKTIKFYFRSKEYFENIYSDFRLIVASTSNKQLLAPDYDQKLIEAGFNKKVIDLLDERILCEIKHGLNKNIPDRLKKLSLYF